MVSGAPPPLERLRRSLGGGDNYRAFLRLFVLQARVHAADIVAAHERGDRHAIFLAAHSLKPTAALVGQFSLSALCAELERRAGPGPDALAGIELFPHVQAALDALRAAEQALHQHLEGADAA